MKVKSYNNIKPQPPKKSIVHLIDSLQVGGAEILLYQTVKRLTEFKHYIITLEPKNAYADLSEYAEIYSLNYSGWKDIFGATKTIQQKVNEIAPDIIHTHLYLASLLTRLALGNNTKIVFSLHTLYSKAIFKKLHLRLFEKCVYHKSHKLIAVSAEVLQDYKMVINKCDKGYVLYNFIDDSFFDLPLSLKSFDQVFPQKWVAVGSLKQVKNYDGMIDMFNKYQGSASKEDIVLEIFGDGSLKEKLQNQINSLSVPIYLKGKAENIHHILDEYDAYISTSLYEGYGIAPMEALARGLPLFLSDIPVYREVYKEHALFFDVNDRSGNSFMDAVNTYQSWSKEEKQHRREAGRKYAYLVANSEAYIKNLLAIYNS